MRPHLRRLLFAPLVLLGCAGAAEAAARVALREAATVSVPEEMVRAHLGGGADIVYDSVLGWRRQVVPNPTFGIESHGFRHAEVKVAKAAGALRGFALGDSQTFGAGLDADQAYASVTERLLRADGLDVEVINTGLSGYRSIQALRLMQGQLAPFEADFVVVDCQGQDSPHDALPPQGAGWRDTAQRGLFESRLYRAARLGIEQSSARLGGVEKRNLALPEFSLPSPFPAARMGGNHDLIQAWADSHQIKVFFLDYPFGEGHVRALVGADDLPAGAHLVATVPALERTGLSVDDLFLDNNHLSARGSEVVAGELAAAIGAWAN